MVFRRLRTSSTFTRLRWLNPWFSPPPRCAAPSDLVLLPVGGSQVLPAAPAAEGVSNRLERPRKRWSIQVVLDGFGWSIQVEFLLP